MVQEDNATPHAHAFTQQVYSIEKVQKIIWCPNSPDLNAIEKAWGYMKRKTTYYGVPSSIKQLGVSWKKEWKALPAEKRHAWIEGVIANVKKVIELNGGNEYTEGRGLKRSWAGRRKLGELFTHSYINTAGDGDWDDDNNTTDSESVEEGDSEVVGE